MAKYTTLNAAMVAQDDLAEAELRYKLLSEVFEEKPTLRGEYQLAAGAGESRDRSATCSQAEGR